MCPLVILTKHDSNTGQIGRQIWTGLGVAYAVIG